MPKYEYIKDSELMSGKQSPNLIFSLISGECNFDLSESALNFLPFPHFQSIYQLSLKVSLSHLFWTQGMDECRPKIHFRLFLHQLTYSLTHNGSINITGIDRKLMRLTSSFHSLLTIISTQTFSFHIITGNKFGILQHTCILCILSREYVAMPLRVPNEEEIF